MLKLNAFCKDQSMTAIINNSVEVICAIQLYAHGVLEDEVYNEFERYFDDTLKGDCVNCPIRDRCLLFTDRIIN